MSRASQAANAVVAAVQQACALYRVPAWRMESMPIMVPKTGGGFRPICVGTWIDGNGEHRTKGMADILAQPRIYVCCDTYVTVPLWIECKAGSGSLRPDQRDFRDFIVASGAFWLQAKDCADVVLDWFRERQVNR